MKKRVLSGNRPTGKLHIGHLLGPLQNWVALQEKYECFYFVADIHALTTLEPQKTKEIKKNTLEMVADWLAVGIDPKKTTLFIQSRVPEHTELAMLLGMVTPLSWLLRCPTFKEQAKEHPDNVNFGLLGYPVLQAADIALYKAEIVPVGQDQVPHVEMAREVIRAFNRKFGQTFKEPQALLSQHPKIMGLDRPREKMSKSFGPSNCLYLADSPATIKEKIKRAVTDLGPSQKMSPGVKNLFYLLEIFAPPQTTNYFKERYKKGTLKYIELKEVLASEIARYLAPIREKREAIIKKPKLIEEILEEGSQKARQIAQKTLKEVKEKMGLS